MFTSEFLLSNAMTMPHGCIVQSTSRNLTETEQLKAYQTAPSIRDVSQLFTRCKFIWTSRFHIYLMAPQLQWPTLLNLTMEIFMTISQADFPSRLSFRAIVAGSLSTFALMMLFLTLGGGLGLWNLDLSELPRQGAGFWIWAFASWIVSLFISSYVAASASRSVKDRDGALHGFIIWAASCVLGCALLAVTTGKIFGGLPGNVTSPMIFAVFVGDLIALGAALFGGIKGASYESQFKPTEEKRKTTEGRKFEQAFANP